MVMWMLCFVFVGINCLRILFDFMNVDILFDSNWIIVLLMGVYLVCVDWWDKIMFILLIFEIEVVVFVCSFCIFILVCFIFLCEISFCFCRDCWCVRLFLVFFIVVLLVWFFKFVVESWDCSFLSCCVLILIKVMIGLLVFICWFFFMCYCFICLLINVFIGWVLFLGLSELIILVL